MEEMIKYYNEILDYDIKALIVDYTSIDLWVLKLDKAAHLTLNALGDWETLSEEQMTEEEFVTMVFNQSFVKIIVDKY